MFRIFIAQQFNQSDNAKNWNWPVVFPWICALITFVTAYFFYAGGVFIPIPENIGPNELHRRVLKSKPVCVVLAPCDKIKDELLDVIDQVWWWNLQYSWEKCWYVIHCLKLCRFPTCRKALCCLEMSHGVELMTFSMQLIVQETIMLFPFIVCYSCCHF